MILLGRSGYVARNLATGLGALGFDVAARGRPDCDLEDWPAALADLRGRFSQPSAVVCVSGITRTAGGAESAFRRNVVMAETLARLGRMLPIAHLIFVSSADVFGHPTAAIRPDTAPAPEGAYGQSKAESEAILAEGFPGRLTLLRPPGIWGGSGDSASLIARFAAIARMGGTIRLSGGGGALRDLLWMDDLVWLVAHLLRRGPVGALNAGPGRPVSVAAIAQAVIAHIGRGGLEAVPAAERDFDLSFDPACLGALACGRRWTSPCDAGALAGL
ncbi:MAG TPA: NAD(P)-dependent oxidoreductase [Magnetospirillum sp.]|nr:NAD(P)-dependent oxidoreductase [Magnetospirillum sp.]